MSQTILTSAVTPAAPRRRVRTGRWRALRAWTLAVTSGLLTTAVAVLILPIGMLTLFRARRCYAAVARRLSLTILWLYGVELRRHPTQSFPSSQTIYVSNHTSTLDLFVLVALGLPNCRFFLSGFVRKFVPLGVISWMLGTFFTVPQNRPAERARIFQRAERILRRTGESVYLSPEGGRIITGEIGPFNKGAFHLATNLHVPIVPFYIAIPRDVDPGLGYDAHPGTVRVHVLPAVETTDWTLADLDANRERVRAILRRAHEELRCA
jgi:1-acyl-sn-glycerol-3-phosphate acyltransferase